MIEQMFCSGNGCEGRCTSRTIELAGQGPAAVVPRYGWSTAPGDVQYDQNDPPSGTAHAPPGISFLDRSRGRVSSSPRSLRAPRRAGARAVDPGIQPRGKGIGPLDHQVYGYLPYWRLDGGTADRLDYSLVSTIALFGLGIKKDGDIDMAWRGTMAYLSATRPPSRTPPTRRASGSSRCSSCSTRARWPR